MNQAFANHGCRTDSQEVRGICMCAVGSGQGGWSELESRTQFSVFKLKREVLFFP